VIVLTLARKPLIRSVAVNALEHGTGGINIDGTRILGSAWKWGTQTDIRGGGYGTRRPSDGSVLATNVKSNPMGRWPANLILCHLPGCRKTGTTTVPGYQINRWSDGAKPFGGGAGHPYEGTTTPVEQVDLWDCQLECPVAALDEQSGDCPGMSGGGAKTTEKNPSWVIQPFNRQPVRSEWLRGDSGGAARFFKQVGGRLP